MKTLNENLKHDKEKPPEHYLIIAKIQRVFMDSFNITTSGDYAYTPSRKEYYKTKAIQWINSDELDYWASLIQVEPSYLRRIHNELTQHYKSGKIDNKLLKLAINRLTEKL